MREKGWELEFAAAELRADREVVMAAVGRDGEALAFAAPELRADREARNPTLYRFVEGSLLNYMFRVC